MDLRDERFVTDSWAKSFRESDYAGLIQNCDWFPVMLPQLSKLITMPSMKTTIAYDPSDTDRVADIYGWICVELCDRASDFLVPLVYYVFVKAPYRRKGIARGLFAAAGIDPRLPFLYACRTYVVDELEGHRQLRRLAPHAKFAPMKGRH